jgi:hypothetical protein
MLLAGNRSLRYHDLTRYGNRLTRIGQKFGAWCPSKALADLATL